MKQRIVSAVIGLALLGCVLIFADGAIFNVVIALVSLLAVYEVLAATKYFQNRALAWYLYGFCGVRCHLQGARFGIFYTRLLCAVCFGLVCFVNFKARNHAH